MIALPDIAGHGNAASIALPVRGNNGIVEYSGGPNGYQRAVCLPACPAIFQVNILGAQDALMAPHG